MRPGPVNFQFFMEVDVTYGEAIVEPITVVANVPPTPGTTSISAAVNTTIPGITQINAESGQVEGPARGIWGIQLLYTAGSGARITDGFFRLNLQTCSV